MTIIAKLLKDSGFATTAGQVDGGNYLDVFLSVEDANAVLAEHKTGGLKSVDAAVRRFGKLLLSKLGSNASNCVIDGYWVDKTTQKIAVRITKSGVEKKADDGGAKEKVNKISENESIKNDFISLHDSMITMRTKPTSGGDADLTEKKSKVREAVGKSAGRGTKKTAEEPMPMSMDAPGGETTPVPTEMPDTSMGMPDAEGDAPGSVEAFEQAEKGFIDYITTSVPVDRAVEIATDIYEQVGSGKSEEKPKSEESSEPKSEEKAEEHEESETPAEEKKEEEGTEKKESLKKTESVKEACLRFRKLAFKLKSMKGKKLSAETKDEIDEVIDKAVKGLEENVPLEEATKIMQDAMSGQSAAPAETAPAEVAPEAAPEGEKAPGSEMAFASIKNKLARNQKSTKKTAAGFDIVTDTWSGKPEGKPEQSVEDHDGLAAMPGYKKEPTVEDIVHANETPKVDKPKDTPDFAQETVKKAVLAFKAVEHMTSMGSIEESQREDEFARLMKLSDAQFKAEIYNIRKISGKVGELVVDGKYADLNTIFN